MTWVVQVLNMSHGHTSMDMHGQQLPGFYAHRSLGANQWPMSALGHRQRSQGHHDDAKLRYVHSSAAISK
jgi:hypothetical protein